MTRATETDVDNWLELRPNVRYGVTTDGQWAVSTAQGLAVLTDSGQFYRLLVLLERPMEVVMAEIDAYRSRCNVHVQFPVAVLIAAGLEQNSEHWAALALAWFAKLQPRDQEPLTDALRVAATAKGVGQRNRQIADRELKRMTRNK